MPNLPRLLVTVAAAVVAFLLGPPAAAQPSGGVGVEVKASKTRLVPGDQFAIAVVFDHEEGWHIHPHEPIVPPEMAGFEPIPTEVLVRSIKGAQAGPVQWPRVHQVPVTFTGGDPVPYGVYEGRAIAYVPILVDAKASGEVVVELAIQYQTCDDSTCLPPIMEDDPEAQHTVRVPIGAESQAAADGDFAGLDSGVFDLMRSGALPAPAPPRAAQPSGPATFFGVALPSASGVLGVFMLAVLSALGGLVLNLTPCVLPVIPIKIMTLSQHAGSHKRGLYLGLCMSVGVVAFWVAAGLPMAFFSRVLDPSRIFGIWWVTGGIGVLIGLMGVGIMGLFSINLPQSVYAISPKADTGWGSFLFGVMTAVLGLPCFGFVAGALLAAAASLPSATILTVFTALGVGMASPYLVLAAFPRLVEKIPRTGPASELVKQVMGLLLMAAAAYFVGSGLIALVLEEPYLARQLHWWAVAVLAVAAGVWLVLRTTQISRRGGPRLVALLIAILVGGGALGVAISFTSSARADYVARGGPDHPSAEVFPGRWQEYNAARLEKALAAGHVVVVDFTAEWCLNCKTLKATVLDRDPVRSALRLPDVVPLEADLTSRKAEGWAKLKELGRTGIPLLAIYGPGVSEPILMNAYTPAQVMEAIEAARGGDLASGPPLK